MDDFYRLSGEENVNWYCKVWFERNIVIILANEGNERN